MNKKIFVTFLLISLFFITAYSHSFATNNTMNKARNTVMNVGNTVGNIVSDAAGAISTGVKDLGNGAATLGNDAVNGMENMGNDTKNAVGTTLDNNDGDYTATRTATNNNMLGMSDTTWTWLILGLVGLAITGLVWYYGAQYEHRNYNND